MPRIMKIGEVAERTGLSLRTIRHYDECGLVAVSYTHLDEYKRQTADREGSNTGPTLPGCTANQ